MKTTVSLVTMLAVLAMAIPGPAQNGPPPSVDPNAVLPQAPPPGTPPAPPQAYVPPSPAGTPTEGPAVHFYYSLASHGAWMNIQPYGWVWQPAVAVADPSWRPYYNSGRWVWLATGWYWQSTYVWGWAPFHYGRWLFHDGIGWMWVPDIEWGPAWVTWTETETHYGWAPLPPVLPEVPGAGIGISIRDGEVTWSAYVGLPLDRYIYVPRYRHCDNDDWYDHGDRRHHFERSHPEPVHMREPVVCPPPRHEEPAPAPRTAPTRRTVEISRTVAPAPQVIRRPAAPSKPAPARPAQQQARPVQQKSKPEQEKDLPAANSRAMRVARLLAR